MPEYLETTVDKFTKVARDRFHTPVGIYLSVVYVFGIGAK